MRTMDASERLQVAEVFDRAADAVQFEGWCKFRFWRHKSSGMEYCVLGAIRKSSEELSYRRYGAEWGFEDPEGERREIAHLLGLTEHDPAEWNNRLPDGAGGLVADTLRGAAKRLREEV